MKKLLLIIACAVACGAHAQQPIAYQAVLKASDTTLSKEALFSIVNHWLAITYSSGKAVTDLTDQNTGTIVAKPIIPFFWRANFVRSQEPSTAHYTLQIEVKSGKVRVSASNYDYAPNYAPYNRTVLTNEQKPRLPGNQQWLRQREWNAAQDAVEKDWQNTIASLRVAIEKPTPAKSDW